MTTPDIAKAAQMTYELHNLISETIAPDIDTQYVSVSATWRNNADRLITINVSSSSVDDDEDDDEDDDDDDFGDERDELDYPDAPHVYPVR